MTAAPAKPSHTNSASRCAHLSAAGSRCRLPARAHSPFCGTHAKITAQRREADDLTVALTQGLEEFTSAADINDFLSRLLLLLAQDRISPRRGAVMAYTANLLLRTLPAIEEERSPRDAKKLPPRIVFQIPGPPHETEGLPEPSPVP
jgi:hypothetical protein